MGLSIVQVHHIAWQYVTQSQEIQSKLHVIPLTLKAIVPVTWEVQTINLTA